MYTDAAAIAIGIFAIVFSVGAGLVTASAVIQTYLAALDRRIAYLDRKVNQMLDQFGVVYDQPQSMPVVPQQPSPATLQTIESYLRQGKNVDAIKTYHDQTGAGLKDSRDAIEAMIESMGFQQIDDASAH